MWLTKPSSPKLFRSIIENGKIMIKKNDNEITYFRKYFDSFRNFIKYKIVNGISKINPSYRITAKTPITAKLMYVDFGLSLRKK